MPGHQADRARLIRVFWGNAGMKIFKIGCIVYCILYLLTTFVATWNVENAMARDFKKWTQIRKRWDPGYPTFTVKADPTIIPFVVKVKHGALAAPLAGRWYSSYYFWFFGFRYELARKTIAISQHFERWPGQEIA